jgi:hypothetical protein
MNAYLRIEAVNLGHFVYDTADLSTIRGGGLLLLESVDWVEDWLGKHGVQAKPVIRGASAGLFIVEASPKPLPELRADVDSALRSEFPHATFVVDAIETNCDDFGVARAKLVNLNRLRQMQGPSLIYPAVRGVAAGAPVCELDLVRPGPISQSSGARRDYGRGRKQTLYAEILRRDAGIPEEEILRAVYATDLHEIAGDSSQWGSLEDKMAIIYLDGNKFGNLLQKKSREEQARFSTGLREWQARFLAELLKNYVWGNSSWMNNAGQTRLETLLWGGDEAIWVVPAWKGWELLELFYQHLSLWPVEVFGEKLTFSAGLVFCHSKSPIHSIRALAHRLCDCAKKAQDKRNQFAYQVLESFDNIRSLPGGEMVFDASEMGEFSKSMPEVRDAVPRRQLHVILRAIGHSESFESAETTALKNLDPAIAGGIRGNTSRWKHIGELWDYVAAEGIRA